MQILNYFQPDVRHGSFTTEQISARADQCPLLSPNSYHDARHEGPIKKKNRRRKQATPP